MNKKPDIIFAEIPGPHGDLGVITLNRPEALNALNHNMILALDNTLEKWATASDIKAVVMQAGEGRAFCAGGDIRLAYERGLVQDPAVIEFFADEYRMNRRIYHFPKPYIVLLDGITMGGGVGISLYGSHRIASKNFVFAMPETGIGFYPDVGVSYFLARMADKIGFYLGLSGVRLPYNDCLPLGIIDYVVARENFAEIIDKLIAAPLRQETEIAEILKHFSIPVEKSTLMQHQAEIKICFSKNSVEDIIKSLERYPAIWCEQAAILLNTKSPTSLKVTLQQIQNSTRLTFDECLDQDYCLMKHFIRGKDFYEGVRAAVIDKDQTPHWQPASLKDVSAAVVAGYFV